MLFIFFTEPSRARSNQFDFVTANRTELFEFFIIFVFFGLVVFFRSSVWSNRIDQLNIIHQLNHLNDSCKVHFEVRFDQNPTKLFTKKTQKYKIKKFEKVPVRFAVTNWYLIRFDSVNAYN